jgi:hypothetical protein
MYDTVEIAPVLPLSNNGRKSEPTTPFKVCNSVKQGYKHSLTLGLGLVTFRFLGSFLKLHPRRLLKSQKLNKRTTER